MSSSATVTVVEDLGRIPYARALEIQRDRWRRVVDERGSHGSGGAPAGSAGPMYVLILEHDPPVITISGRRSARAHLIASEAILAERGVEIAETDRGGDITYHGPGQIVVYPILDLNALRLRLHGYLRFLEEVVIDVLARFDLEGSRDAAATGVWVSPRKRNGAGAAAQIEPARKICAIGVRVSRWVALHGLALNVTTNLDHFDLIVPCGLAGRGVTSMERELGAACPPIDVVKRALGTAFSSAIHERLTASDCA